MKSPQASGLPLGLFQACRSYEQDGVLVQGCAAVQAPCNKFQITRAPVLSGRNLVVKTNRFRWISTRGNDKWSRESTQRTPIAIVFIVAEISV